MNRNFAEEHRDLLSETHSFVDPEKSHKLILDMQAEIDHLKEDLEETKECLEASRSNHISLINIFNELRKERDGIKEELKGMKFACEQYKQIVCRLEKERDEINEKFTVLSCDFSDLAYKNQELINERNDRFTIEEIEKALESLFNDEDNDPDWEGTMVEFVKGSILKARDEHGH